MPASQYDKPADRFLPLIRSAIQAKIPEGAPLALFDVPNHSNVGDSAIYIGELEYLKRYHPGSRLLWVSDVNWPLADTAPALPKETVILIHGGGNLGDTWPRHQAHREAVLRAYPGHRIIQLPQSIEFSNSSAFEAFCKEAREHRDFHVLARDQESLALASCLGASQVALCPDMALAISHIGGEAVKPQVEVLVLLRTDKESRYSDAAVHCNGETRLVDWVTRDRTAMERAANYILYRYPNRTRTLRKVIYRHLASQRLLRGIRLLQQGKVVVTDRLHGHILSTLLGKPHVVLDNSYQKIARFRKAWSTAVDSCQVASDLDSALALARDIARRA